MMRTTHPARRRQHRLACSLAAIFMASCGGLSTAGLLDPERVDGGHPGSATRGLGDGGATAADDAALQLAVSGAAGIERDASLELPDSSHGSPYDAAAMDGGSFDTVASDGTATDGAVADTAALDAAMVSSPCGELTQCCGLLLIAPALAAACYGPTVQGDAANPSGCASTLDAFRDAGLCP
jgi:hypothetical protein